MAVMVVEVAIDTMMEGRAVMDTAMEGAVGMGPALVEVATVEKKAVAMETIQI